MTARSRLILSILAVLAVLLVGAAGYMVIEKDQGIRFVDALYMTVITVSTVGYDEVWELSSAGKLWTVGVIGVGIATVTYAFTSLVTLVISGELRSLRERKRMDRAIEGLRNHVILCGFGRMGALVAQELHARKVSVVAIDRDHNLQEQLRDLRVPFLIGDATEEEVLLEAGLLRARSVVLALPSDADNVYVALTVHTLCPDLPIVARAENPSTEPKLKRAGASRVVCPHATGAMKIANVLTRPSVVDFVELADQGVDLEIDEYVVAGDSPLVKKTLREAAVRGSTGAMVVAIKRKDGEAIVNPDPDAVLAAGDTLIFVGPAGVSERLDAIHGAH